MPAQACWAPKIRPRIWRYSTMLRHSLVARRPPPADIGPFRMLPQKPALLSRPRVVRAALRRGGAVERRRRAGMLRGECAYRAAVQGVAEDAGTGGAPGTPRALPDQHFLPPPPSHRARAAPLAARAFGSSIGATMGRRATLRMELLSMLQGGGRLTMMTTRKTTATLSNRPRSAARRCWVK